MKHLPATILGLTLLSALAVLVIGAMVSRDERTVVVGDSRNSATAFTARFLSELEDLTDLYESHLLDIADQVPDSSSIVLAARSRDTIGIEQITRFDLSGRKTPLDMRRDRKGPTLPVPRALGESDSDKGILVDIEALTGTEWNDGYQWLNQPGYQLHFAVRLDKKKGVVVFRINREIVQQATEEWLNENWLAGALEPVRVAGVTLQMETPDGNSFARNGSSERGANPSLLLPVSTHFGDWKISSWDQVKTVTSYRQPILVGSAALSILLALVGFLGYFQQKNAVKLAEQRVSFVNRVSHELRTPLTNILLNLDLAADSLPAKSPGTERRLDLIREETGRLSRLLDNVLSFSRREKTRYSTDKTGQQALQLTPCNLQEVIETVLSQFTASLKRKDLEVKRNYEEGSSYVFADRDALSQIVSNLISNVEKYASEGGVFEISFGPSESGSNEISLTICDNGPGILKKDGARVFLPFTRLSDSTIEGVSGTGLGLAIARDLAENMGGSLELKVEEDKENGACFELTLPRSEKNILPIAS